MLTFNDNFVYFEKLLSKKWNYKDKTEIVFYSFNLNIKFLIYRRSQFAPRQRLDQTSEELRIVPLKLGAHVLAVFLDKRTH